MKRRKEAEDLALVLFFAVSIRKKSGSRREDRILGKILKLILGRAPCNGTWILSTNLEFSLGPWKSARL
jgi:hypothetical protein